MRQRPNWVTGIVLLWSGSKRSGLAHGSSVYTAVVVLDRTKMKWQSILQAKLKRATE